MLCFTYFKLQLQQKIKNGKTSGSSVFFYCEKIFFDSRYLFNVFINTKKFRVRKKQMTDL